jgi:hypothetical protein
MFTILIEISIDIKVAITIKNPKITNTKRFILIIALRISYDFYLKVIPKKD